MHRYRKSPIPSLLSRCDRSPIPLPLPLPVSSRPAALLLPERRRPRAGRALPAGGAGQQDPLPPPGAGPGHPGHHPPPGRLQHACGQLRQAHLRQGRWVELHAGTNGRLEISKRRLVGDVFMKIGMN